MTQPEALRLAEDLEIDYFGDVVAHDAAAELRRLAAVEAQRDALLEALREIESATVEGGTVNKIARAAIKAVEENT